MLYMVLILLCLVLLFYCNLSRKQNYWKKWNIVQDNSVIKRFLTKKCSLGEVYKDIYDEYLNERYIGTYLSQPTIIVKDLRDVQAVLCNDFKNFYSRGMALATNPRDTLADNVSFVDDHSRWKLMRHKMSPIFTGRKSKKMFYIMDRCARDFVEVDDNLELIKNNSFTAISALTTGCIAATVFGVNIKTKDAIDSPFLDIVSKFVKPTLAFNLKFFIANFSKHLFNVLNLKFFAEHEKFLIGTLNRVLDKRRESKDNRYDFIDTCIELQDNGIMKDETTGYELEPTTEFLAANAFFFLIGGGDTSATIVHFCLLELASNPEILSRLHDEIDEVFAKCGDTLTYDAVMEMEYLDMVLNETMRKYPPIGSIQRQCTNKTALPGGLEVEKDTIIIIPILALQRDERNFPNPDVFDPERFAPKNVNNVKKYSNIPFGGGNRGCFGFRFSRPQMKSTIAWLLRKHTLKEKFYEAKKFDNSTFAVKDSKANVELIPRNL